MPKQHQREKEGEYLSGSHDDGKYDGAELLECVEDEQLASGRGDRQDHHVHQGGVVSQNEGERGEELAGQVQGIPREDHGPDVDSEHHLELIDAELLEDSALPLRGEGVTTKVKRQ